MTVFVDIIKEQLQLVLERSILVREDKVKIHILAFAFLRF